MITRKVANFVWRLWKEWRMTVFFIVFVVIPVKSSLADWNWVPTGSMNPTILEGDLVYVDKVAYDLRFPLTLYRLAEWSDPQRGDIVICLSPDDGTRLVKRVIGEPGDTIEMKDNVLILNGEPVPYTRVGVQGTEVFHGEFGIFAMEDLDGTVHPVMSIPSVSAMRTFGLIRVPQDRYFVMGDNRDVSRDSRFFGFVERKRILGKVKGVIGSVNITDKFQPRFSRFFAPLK
jgi:signal peptidase I